MALTGLTPIQITNLNVSGIATFEQEVGVGGTLTYQDVTNVDAVGIITARSGVNVSAGQLDVGNNIKIGNAGVATAANFKTGVSDLHSVGLTLSGGQIDVGSNIKIGNAGVVTATAFHGDISNATGAAAGLGTALSSTQTSPLNKLYYTNRVLSVGSTITVDHPASATGAYTQYADIQVEDDADLIVADGDDLIPDILGLGGNGTTGAGGAGRLLVDNIVNRSGSGAPTFPNGAVVTGIVTATSFSGSGANLTNLPVPTTITVADESSDTTCNPLFVTTTSGNLAPKTGTNLTFNSASGNLRAGSLFVGTGTNESKTQDGVIIERNSSDGLAHITAGRSGGNYSGMNFYVAGASGVTKRHLIDYESNFRWYGADGTTERMRLFSTGQLGINRDTTPLNGVKLMVQNGSGNVFYTYHEGTGNNYSMLCRNDRATGSTQATQIIFLASGNTFVGDIRSTGSSTAYNTSSDYRLKENVTPISDGITRLKTLKPSRFNFKVDKDTTVDGFLAHEVTAVPEAISGTKDEVVTQAMIDNGDAPSDSKLDDPIYQQIDQSKIVPLLTAALQEAITKIETLEAKVSALEGS